MVLLKFINRYSYCVFLIIPSMILINSLLLTCAMGPFWRYADPCYLYLLNGLHLLKGISLTHIDHPGTPLQILILAIMFLMNMGSSVSAIEDKVLANPEFYLSVIHIVLILTIFITSVLLAVYIYRKTQDILPALLTQLPGLTFLVTKSFESNLPVPPVVANVNPEPLLIVILNLFNLSWFILFYAQTFKEKIRATLFLGFICGLGLATKFTFLPILFCALIILSWRLKLLFTLVSLLSFCLWTLPIIHLYPDLWAWVKGIATHTGVYGNENQGIVNWPDIIKDILKNILPGYWLFMIFCISAFLWSSIKIIRAKKEPVQKFLCAITFGIICQFAMVAQHYSSHYLLTGIGLFSSAFVLFYIGALAQHKTLKILTLIFILIFTLQGSIQAGIYCSKLASLTKEVSSLTQKIYAQFPGSAVIAPADTNPFFSQEHALLFANGFYSRLLYNKSFTHKESEKLSILYPHSLYFNFDATSISNDNPGYGICDFNKRVYADDAMASYPYVLLLNYKFDFNYHNGFSFSNHPYSMRLIDDSKYADIYLLTGSSDKESSELLSASMAYLEKGRYREAFALALKSRELNYQPKGQVEFILSVIYNRLNQH